MQLKFKINKSALATDIFLFNKRYKNKKELKKSPFLFWYNLEKKLFKKFKDEPAYYLINPVHYDWAFKKISIEAGEKGFEKTFLENSKVLDKIYKEIFKSKEFKKIYSETIKYKDWVEKEWNKKEKFILNYFKNTLGLKIPDYKVTVYIFHPKSHNGRADYPTKTLLWGHPEDWKNYSVIYIAHELLHIIADKNYTDIMHAIIELATDNELRIRLNKKGKYFKENKLDIGHPHLKKLEKKIYPYWKEYLEDRKNKNIISLEKELLSKFKSK